MNTSWGRPRTRLASMYVVYSRMIDVMETPITPRPEGMAPIRSECLHNLLETRVGLSVVGQVGGARMPRQTGGQATSHGHSDSVLMI